jgi:imidazolonepropionase
VSDSPSVSIDSAAQVLRPPSDGLPYLRQDRADAMRLEPASLTTAFGRIVAFESSAEADITIDARGCAVIPGFVDCHTHLPFAGWREREYAMKIAGESYEAIARAGGGIRSSARALSESSDHEVVAQASGLAFEMLAHGTTTFECKSGYGLSVDGELRALRLAHTLAVPQTTTVTALLAHALPDGFDRLRWMQEVAAMMPSVSGQASALDIYVESIAFGNDDLRTMGGLARQYELDLRAHVEQFNANGSVPVAVAEGARSVDHLACVDAAGIEALAGAETAAVLLPGAEFLGDEHVAPARALADAGAICALGTDLNPGTSPIASLPVIIGLAVRRYRWSVLEALLACTLNAAWALRLSGELGSLEVDKRADVLVLDGPVERVPYRFGHNPVAAVLVDGELVHVRPDFSGRVRR